MWDDMQCSVGQNGWLHSWKKIARVSSSKDFEWIWSIDGMIWNSCFFLQTFIVHYFVFTFYNYILQHTLQILFIHIFSKRSHLGFTHLQTLLALGGVGVPLRVRQRMTEREPPLSSDKTKYPFLTDFGILLPADKIFPSVMNSKGRRILLPTGQLPSSRRNISRLTNKDTP